MTVPARFADSHDRTDYWQRRYRYEVNITPELMERIRSLKAARKTVGEIAEEIRWPVRVSLRRLKAMVEAA